MSVRDLDERFVPAAAERTRRAVSAAGALWQRVVSSYRAIDPQTLDDRFAASGPLALARDVPVVGVLVVLAVLVAGGSLAVKREAERAREPSEALPGVTVAASSTLGPAVGESVAQYVDDAAGSLTRAVQTAPGSTRLALVSFSDYVTPTGTRARLSGYDVKRVYVRVRAAGDLATPLPVEVKGDLATHLQSSFRDLARTKQAAQKAYQGYVDALGRSDERNDQFRELYEAFAKSSAVEAREFARGCACVYSAVVSANPGQLLTLRARQGVRAVEVAEAGVELSAIQVQPLLPEVSGVVPKPSLGVKR